MKVIEEYKDFKFQNKFNPGNFDHRVKLQLFLRDRIDDIWKENPKFSNAGLFTNYMTKVALGFAYYDCKPSSFCKERCYGLPIHGRHDYYMLKLAVITSEAFRNTNYKFLSLLENEAKKHEYLKIGHWGDTTIEQVPNILHLVRNCDYTKFWWYTRKIEIALRANEEK